MSDADLPFWIKLQGFQKWAAFWATPKVAHSFLLELGIFSLTEIVTRKVVGIHSTKIFFLLLSGKNGPLGHFGLFWAQFYFSVLGNKFYMFDIEF